MEGRSSVGVASGCHEERDQEAVSAGRLREILLLLQAHRGPWAMFPHAEDTQALRLGNSTCQSTCPFGHLMRTQRPSMRGCREMSSERRGRRCQRGYEAGLGQRGCQLRYQEGRSDVSMVALWDNEDGARWEEKDVIQSGSEPVTPCLLQTMPAFSC